MLKIFAPCFIQKSLLTGLLTLSLNTAYASEVPEKGYYNLWGWMPSRTAVVEKVLPKQPVHILITIRHPDDPSDSEPSLENKALEKRRQLHARKESFPDKTEFSFDKPDQITGDYPYCQVGNDVILTIKCKTTDIKDCAPWAPFFKELKHATTLIYKYNTGNPAHREIWKFLSENPYLKTLENIEAPSALALGESYMNTVLRNNATSLKNINFNLGLLDILSLLYPVTNFAHLEKVNLNGSQIEDFGMEALAKFVTNSPLLSSFKFWNWDIDENHFYGVDTFQKFLNSVESHPRLAHFSFQVENTACAQFLISNGIFKILHNPHLTKLSLVSYGADTQGISPDIFGVIGESVAQKALEKFKFSYFSDSNQFISFINGLTKTTTLRALNFSFYSDLSDDAAIAFANFIENNTSLSQLSFGLKLTPVGEEKITEAFGKNKSIRCLKLNECSNLSTAGAQKFLEALETRPTPLEVLNVGTGDHWIEYSETFKPLWNKRNTLIMGGVY